jgi:hypothetical protein
MIMGFLEGQPVLVRLRGDLFTARVNGWWEDAKGKGPIVMLANGKEICIDPKRITRFTDTDEVPTFDGDDL